MLFRNHALVAAAATMSVLLCAVPAHAENEDRPSVMSQQAYDAAAGIPPVFKVTPEDHHDHLPSLRDAVVPNNANAKRTHFEGLLPLPPGSTDQTDGAVQRLTSQTRNTPTTQLNFDGVGDGFTGPNGTFTVNSAPPDTDGAVGATQYVSLVNSGLAVFDKTTGNVVYGPVPTNTLWSGFGGGCETNNDGDGVVIYDRAAGRWVVSQFSVATTPYLQCVAVSQTSDATGGWNRYAFDYGSTLFPDYPKMGSWPDAYYETFNMFSGNTPAANLCAYDRTSMLAGNAATQQCFQLSTAYTGVLPSDLDGSTPPPVGSPNYLINFGTNKLNLWKFHVDWTTPGNSTLAGPTAISVSTFSPACSGFGGGKGTCVSQPGTTQKLDSLSDRMMFRLAYRNFGDHESLVASHSVKLGTGTSQYAGVRWYEIRSPGATPTVYQQSTFSPDTSFRWMPSIAMDSAGDIAVGYSASSKANGVYPSVRYSGRTPTDASGTLETEQSLLAGTASQSGSQNLTRWGDYSAMTIDPIDDCTFWYTNEYIPTTGEFNWKTRIASFKFPGCAPAGYSLNYTADVNGAIVGTTPQFVAPGGSGTTVTAVPNTGYHFAQWSDASVANPRTDTNVAGNISVQAQFAANVLVFTTQPTNVAPGNALGTIAVSEQDGSGNTIADNATVDFTMTTVCGTLDLGSVQMANGVATLDSAQVFYTLHSGYQIQAAVTNPNPTPMAAVASATFDVASPDIVFANGFESCRP